MDKASQLIAILGQLSDKEALALARAVELGRLQRHEELPTDLVLGALRPRLRNAHAARVPSLRRLVAEALVPFLTDREHEPRLPGLIARATVAPWWRGLTRLAGHGLAALDDRLVALYAAGDTGGYGDLAREAQAAAAAWTHELAAELARPKGDAALRQLFPRPAMVVDVSAIGHALALAGPLGTALAAIDRVLDAAARLDGRLILDLTPDAVTAAKQHYILISETHGMDASYLALALLNRLRQPWHILRLGRALSWKPNDSLLRDTEFGVIGERLILDLQRAASDIVALIGQRGLLPDLNRLTVAITDYMDDAEGLLGEFGFRRDSPWGEAILQTRMALSDALGRDFLGRVAEQGVLARVMPARRLARDAAPGDGPADAAAARLLLLLMQRGSRHGFGQSAREAVEAVGAEIDRRAALLLDDLRQAPGAAAVEAQIAAAAEMLAILFDDGRADILARRLRMTGQVPA